MMKIDSSSSDYVQAWKGKLRALILEYTILTEGAFSTKDVYPYTFNRNLIDNWNWDEKIIPSLPTIYSVIKRLEQKGLIRVNRELVGGRVQKKIQTIPAGFDALEKMKQELKNIKKYIKRNENE